MTEQGQRAVDGGRGEPPLDRGLALADLPHGGEPLGLVLADTAGCDLGQRRLLPELGLEEVELAPIRLERALPRFGGQVAVSCLRQRDSGPLRLLGFDLQERLGRLGLGVILGPLGFVPADLLARDVGTRGKAISWLQRATTEAWLAETYLYAGRPQEAQESATRALAIATHRGERPNEARSRLLLGHVAAYDREGEAPGVEPHYREALSIAEDLGMRPLVAHCHLGLGKLYHRTDKREQAREHLATATTMYRDMRMTYWLEKAEAEITHLRR